MTFNPEALLGVEMAFHPKIKVYERKQKANWRENNANQKSFWQSVLGFLMNIILNVLVGRKYCKTPQQSTPQQGTVVKIGQSSKFKCLEWTLCGICTMVQMLHKNRKMKIFCAWPFEILTIVYLAKQRGSVFDKSIKKIYKSKNAPKGPLV